MPSETFEKAWIESYQRARGHKPATWPKHALAAGAVAERAEAAGVDFDRPPAGCMGATGRAAGWERVFGCSLLSAVAACFPLH